ncbi:ABC transporter substrate-binding protein [Bacillus methanolicus]|uniref:NlpA lipoprotein n=1 Tax=Bacillus methanolicus (strain MGA3 / ATCC 53907) TaxID=796606 RepID=I3E8N0_BACMM|nr:ABC transporter substrate-binding protein [Bacillus methanolicus]AIE60120.1 NlpA lipoprotein [Bacillus methanolicus MGA3]EIJ82851.1 NLPA lipoprotein [Bacillus methanolicus MGA3]UQD52118.1 metal ABC transporter substrate-binding protein [Bacillus methanolicus]
MKKKLRRSFVLLLLIMNLIFLSACGSSQVSSGSSGGGKRTIKIGYLPITHAVPLYIEDEIGKKDFKNIKLELVKFGSWPELMDALNTGRIDGASVLVELAMKAKEQGIDLKAVALGHRDGNVIVVSKDIKSVKDLKGKNFAIPHKFSTHNILLYQTLKKAGLKYNDVNVIELPPAEMPAALAEGRISGYVVAEPFGALSVAMNKGKVLFQSKDLWVNSVCCALVLRNEFIRNENQAAQELVNEYVKSGKLAELKDEQTHKISSKYMKVDKKVMDLSFQWISYDDLRLNKSSYEQLRKYMIEMGLSKNPPTYEDFVDNSLIDKAM